jgi:hypothetical protein
VRVQNCGIEGERGSVPNVVLITIAYAASTKCTPEVRNVDRTAAR